MNASCEVLIAAEGAQKELLMQEFPTVRFIPLQGYRLSYGRNGWLTRLKIGTQIPKIFLHIRKERTWLADLIRHEQPDAIISDNRYGLSAPGLPSVFITHQLHIKTGLGKIFDQWIASINHRYIRSFSACWIPDMEGSNSLSGSLSQPARLPGMDIRHIGPLCRFEACRDPVQQHVLIILSGPEPQRSILENMILKQLNGINELVVIVRGLPLGGAHAAVTENITVHNHLPAKEMNKLICNASVVICRAGYTSIMELMMLGKKAVLIPTPGQAEQEFLAGRLYEKKLALCVWQDQFNLRTCLDAAESFIFSEFEKPAAPMLRDTIRDFLASIKISA